VKSALLALAAGLAILGTACAPNLVVQTPAPPLATAALRPLSDTIELTQGVGLGFRVWCPWTSCEDVRATTDTPGVAHVYLAHLDSRVYMSQTTARSIALVGVQPGTTMLHVWSGDHVHDFTVKVSAPTPTQDPPKAAP
jgi:hypothetical protein